MLWRGNTINIVDTHADSLLSSLKGRALGEWSSRGQLDFPRMRHVGHSVQFLSCWVEPQYKPEQALARFLQFADQFRREIAANTDTVMAVTDLQSLEHALQSQKIGVIMSVEGAESVGTDLALLRTHYRLGVRLLSLTWNERNALADGAGEDPAGGGLSRAGREIVQEMNRIGMVVDVSHLAEAGFWDVLAVSEKPVIASHSNCRELQPHRRNLHDAQIRALAQSGGIQGITFVRGFLGGTEDITRVVDHMIHQIQVVGDDKHIGLGSDFDGVEVPVTGLEDVTALPRLADGLSDRGVSDETIRRIFGENYISFFRESFATAMTSEEV